MPCRPPLCPAGHLPHRWGDHKGRTLPITSTLRRVERDICSESRCFQPISPPVGEMPGRAEGACSA
ncbi:hypothetical protein ELH76_12970 [Rhizobium ruizarguesonis]|nr:hypothetical protein ELH76_12970 [Rhizobium ruizarguesonis]